MFATKMQLAFVAAPTVTTATPLGKRILETAMKQYEEQKTELAKLERKAFLRRTIFFMLPKNPGEHLAQFFIRAEESVITAYQQEELI